MILQDFSYFLRVVELGSITKAAESLYVSQPSLTKYIHKLERELGISLFDRSHLPLRLTDAGRCFYEYITGVESEQRNLLTRIAEIKSNERATITIGMPLWRSSVILPAFLPVFCKKHPLISIKLVEGPARKLEEAIMDDEVDFCIMNLPVSYQNVSYLTLAREYIYLIGSNEDPFVQKLNAETPDREHIPVDIHRFKDQPFILNRPGQHITGYVNNMLSQNDMELNCRLRTSNVTTAINLAASGLGFTFVPELGTRSRYFPSDRVTKYLVNTPPLTCEIAGVYKKSTYLSHAARTFLEEIKEYFDALSGQFQTIA